MDDGKYIAEYIRVSVEKGERERDSVSNQKEQIKLYANSMKKPYRLYQDIGISAKDKERPAPKALIEDIKAVKVGTVLVTKLDRITRSLQDLLWLKELFEKYNVSFVSLAQHLDTSNPMGRFSFFIPGSVAQLEREMDAERVSEVM